MKKIRLGVNIDHVATLRNARGENFPNLLKISSILKKLNIDLITVHLREDRRHINDNDLKELKNKNDLPLNLEMAATQEMKTICLDLKPYACCIVPEKREELTTEGGLDVKNNLSNLENILFEIKQKKQIRTSLFIEPDINQIKLAKKLGVNAIEIHTGKYSNLFEKGKYNTELKKITEAANFAHKIGLEVHAGHGLNLRNVKNIIDIKSISELNIGYSIVAQSIFSGLKNVIEMYKKMMN